MAGTRAGGLKARDKNLARDPNFYKKAGAIGGRSGTGHAFAHGKLDPSETGKLGAGIERRKRANTN